MSKRQRTTRAPECGYKSPITGEMVRFDESQDAEMLLMNERELAGDHVVGITRIRELTEQSAQNRARIQKRMFADVGAVGAVARVSVPVEDDETGYTGAAA